MTTWNDRFKNNIGFTASETKTEKPYRAKRKTAVFIIHYKSMMWVFDIVALFRIGNDVIKPAVNQKNRHFESLEMFYKYLINIFLYILRFFSP